MRKPDFFIVGAPKSGTTAIYDCLAQHPDVFLPEKEIHYFGTDLYSPTYLRDTAKYRLLFDQAQNEKRIGEASVWYLYSRRAAEEIKDFNPASSIIIMLRNPVDTIHSLHSQRLFIGTEDIYDFEEALNAEEDRKKGLRLPKNPHLIEGLFYREVGKYAAQVERYLKTFAREQVQVIIYDDFKRDTAETYRDTFSFLGIDSDFKPEIKIVNPNKEVRSKAVRAILNQPPSPLKRVAAPLIRPALRRRLFKLARSLNTSYGPRRPLGDELRRQLQTEFAPDVARLSEILGRDLTYWCRVAD